MTELLKKAFAEASKLPETEQNLFANWILAELRSEELWDELFANSARQLEMLAKEAAAEYNTGKTQPFTFDAE